MHDHDPALAREVDEPLHEARVDDGGRGVVRKRDDHRARPRARALVRLAQVREHVLVGPHRDLHDRRAREHRREQMDRVARCGHERRVARLDQQPQQVREPFLRADRRDRLALGVERHPEPPRVQIADRLAQLGDPAARGVPVVARLRGSLRELRDGQLRRGDVRVAEPQVDHVLACPPELELQPLDLGEGVRRQQRDPA